ncbi:hypothetical protein DFH08DRAFT_861464 [Mycena albidolilacea]|uniref:Uncharacterized protein n=1 Tax=Mycena albidolilacea TaxID=1033008 RepID=A0AAD7EUS4_9AGAR|nr:hypothetical protein DFH08DRAFT_861464 [Mycena albidolilacea]
MATTQTTGKTQPARPVLFASLPTIKVIEPPKGSFSTRNDQWCLTYCSQNVSGRIHSKAPWCRSVCIRKVFSHEVRNILQFQSHHDIGPDGKARYPLPPEGQPLHLPRYLGGKPIEDPEHGRRAPEDTKFWDEGWYFWKTTNFLGVYSSISQMQNNLERQVRQEESKQTKRKQWLEYQEFLKTGEAPTMENKWMGPVVPPNFGPDAAPDSLLVPLPLETDPLLQPLYQLLAPAQHSVQLFRDNLAEGNYRKFALRVWDKALTGEPFTLASRACSFGYEQWKNKSKESDDDDKEKES